MELNQLNHVWRSLTGFSVHLPCAGELTVMVNYERMFFGFMQRIDINDNTANKPMLTPTLDVKMALIDRNEIMAQWDTWRKYIADGGGGSWPRDAFEAVLDSIEEKVRDRFKNIINGDGSVIPRIAVKIAIDDLFGTPNPLLDQTTSKSGQ